MPEKQDYRKDYDEFISSYQKGTTTGEEVGEMISRMAQYFTSYNLSLAAATVDFSRVCAATEQTIDENGKQISSAKAQKISEASSEAGVFTYARAHVQNIEQLINALKSLQKGVLQEYSHLGAM